MADGSRLDVPTALNEGDETPGSVSYSSIYTRFHDELVQPHRPVPTAALDWGHEGPNTRNLAVQDKCPGRFVDYLTIGTVDLATAELVIDALTHPGPVDPGRVPDSACREGLMAGQRGQVAGIVSAWEYSRSQGFPKWHMRSSEPPLKPYARR